MENIQFKEGAKAAASYLKEQGFDVPHTRMLEALARGFGERNWSTLASRLQSLAAPAEPTNSRHDYLMGILAPVRDTDCFVLTKVSSTIPGAWEGYAVEAKKALPILAKLLNPDECPLTPEQLLDMVMRDEAACFDLVKAEAKFAVVIGVVEKSRFDARRQAEFLAMKNRNLRVMHGYRGEIVWALVNLALSVFISVEENTMTEELSHQLVTKACDGCGVKASVNERNEAALRLWEKMR